MHLVLDDTLSQKSKVIQTSKREGRVKKGRLLKRRESKTSGITKERLRQLKSTEKQKGYPSKSSHVSKVLASVLGEGLRNEEKSLPNIMCL